MGYLIFKKLFLKPTKRVSEPSIDGFSTILPPQLLMARWVSRHHVSEELPRSQPALPFTSASDKVRGERGQPRQPRCVNIRPTSEKGPGAFGARSRSPRPRLADITCLSPPNPPHSLGKPSAGLSLEPSSLQPRSQEGHYTVAAVASCSQTVTSGFWPLRRPLPARAPHTTQCVS